MTGQLLRGAWRAAAPLALVAALAGCSAGNTSPTAAPTRPTVAPTPTPAATTDAATAALLERAAKVSAGLHAYTFSAIETVRVTKTVRSVIRGRVVRGRGVAYTLVAHGKRSQVVRVRGATYVRAVPGKWSKLHKPVPVANPSTTLVQVLRGVTAASSTRSGGATVVTGELPAAAARQAGVPTDGGPAAVRVTIDAAGRVTRLTITTHARAGTQRATVTVDTRYGRFGRVAALRAPA